MEPQCRLQILQEPHGDPLNIAQRGMESHETFKILLKTAWSRMEPHGTTVYTLNTAGVAWRPFKYNLEMHGAAWRPLKYCLKMHGAA